MAPGKKQNNAVARSANSDPPSTSETSHTATAATAAAASVTISADPRTPRPVTFDVHLISSEYSGKKPSALCAMCPSGVSGMWVGYPDRARIKYQDASDAP